MSRKKTNADDVHTFSKDKLEIDQPITHIRVNIFPDGGISRVRVYGKIAEANTDNVLILIAKRLNNECHTNG
ncbi:hypothetical protein JCM18901_409 [Psychrobacter sp. JCM 18901]|nr:hypothetical protein JCM18901_409 [Psychrobacter sp. JCM 18901]